MTLLGKINRVVSFATAQFKELEPMANPTGTCLEVLLKMAKRMLLRLSVK